VRGAVQRTGSAGERDRGAGLCHPDVTARVLLAEYPTSTMPRTIQYSEKYQDDIYEYRSDQL
jgi:hypothetical protein